MIKREEKWESPLPHKYAGWPHAMLTDHDVATGLHSNNSSRNQIIMRFSGTFAKIYHTLLRSLVESIDKPLNIHVKKLGNGGCLDVIKHFLALPLGRKVFHLQHMIYSSERTRLNCCQPSLGPLIMSGNGNQLRAMQYSKGMRRKAWASRTVRVIGHRDE